MTNSLSVFHVRYPVYGLVFPIRESVSPRYEEAKQLADSVERLCHAAPKEQLSLLQAYSTSPTSEVSYWAIRRMARAYPQEAIPFLMQVLFASGLPIRGQIAIDEVLSDAKGNEWQNSPTRRSLLQSWVTGNLTELDISAAISRIDVSSQHGEINGEALLDLMQRAIENQRVPLQVRQSAVSLIGIASNRGRIKQNAGFDFLLKQIKEGKEGLDLSAAFAVKNFIDLNQNQASLLETTSRQVADEKVARILQEAARRSKQ
jgi:hypothetical protein